MSTPPAPTLMSSSSLYDYHLLVPPPSSQPPPQTHLKLILITILVFSVIMIVITFLYLLFRHLHSISTSSDQSTPSHRSAAAVTPLPLFTFSSVVRNSCCDSDCAICLSKFHPRDKLRLLPLCCHAFHAVCIDTWLRTNKTCPLCRSSIQGTDSNIAASLQSDSAGVGRSGSFRLEIGSVRRQDTPEQGNAPTAYSIGSFQYIVDGESEVIVPGHHRSVSVKDESGPVDSSVARDASGERNWLGDYVDRLSATLSYSRRFFTGSSRRIEVGEWPELDGSRVGEEISEWFRWASGV